MLTACLALNSVTRAHGGGGEAPSFDPASVDWFIGADPDQGLTASAGNLAALAPSFGASETLTGAATAPAVLADQGPAGQDMLAYGGGALANFTLVNATTFFLCGFMSLRTRTGDNTLLGYAAGNTNGQVRINSGGAGMAIRRAGGSYVTVPFPYVPEDGRFYFVRFEVYEDNTAQAFLNGVGGTRVAVSGTTTRFERFGGANAMDVGPIFVSLGPSPANIDANMMGYFPGWLPKTFHVDDLNGSDTSVQAWSPDYPLKTLSRASAFKAQPGDTFECVGDFVGQRLDPSVGGTEGAPITFKCTSGGKAWGGTVVTDGWTADGAGIGTRALAYSALGVWYHREDGKTISLVKSTGLAVDLSYEVADGNLRVRIDGVDFSTDTPSIRIADQSGTSFCSTALDYIVADGWDIRHRTSFGIQTFSDSFRFINGKLCFNLNDGSGGNGGELWVEDSWVFSDGQNPAVDSEGDGLSHHGGGIIHATRCVIGSNGFGGFQHQQSVTAYLTDSVLIDNVRDARISYNETAGVGALHANGSLIVVTDRSVGYGAYLEAGHPAASELTVNDCTIVSERSSPTGAYGVYFPDGHGEVNNCILSGFETGVQAAAGRVVTGSGNVADGTLKAGSDNSVTGLSNTDPMFVDAANRNFRLQPGSPAAGKGASAIALDLMDQYLASEFA